MGKNKMKLICGKCIGFITVVVLIEILMVSLVWAIPQKVYFAGFAFLSDHSDIGQEYPYSQTVAKSERNNGDFKIEAILRKKIEKVSNPNIEIVIDELGDDQSANALSLALALDWEDVCVEKLTDDMHKIVLNLHAQVLVFDFNTRKIIYSHPFGVRVNDVSDSRPDSTHIQKLFDQLYFEKVGNLNFLDEFISILRKIKINETDDDHLGVTEVTLGPKASQLMPEKVKNNDQEYKRFVAQQFSSFLAANQGVSVIPHTLGQAISGKMPLRFQNGKAFDIDIPPPDIPIKITIRGFKKAKIDENHTGATWAYGSFIKLNVLDHWGIPVVDTKFKNIAVKTILATAETTIDSDWSAFEESLLKLFDDLTIQISKRSSTWISKRTKDKNAKSQLAKFDSLLKKNQISKQSLASKINSVPMNKAGQR
jgi:DNA-binding protein H-NS